MDIINKGQQRILARVHFPESSKEERAGVHFPESSKE